MRRIWKKLPTFVIRSRYLSSIAWLSWQPANNCHTSALRASGTPLFTRVDSPFGRAPRLLCLRTQENEPLILPSSPLWLWVTLMNLHKKCKPGLREKLGKRHEMPSVAQRCHGRGSSAPSFLCWWTVLFFCQEKFLLSLFYFFFF